MSDVYIKMYGQIESKRGTRVMEGLLHAGDAIGTPPRYIVDAPTSGTGAGGAAGSGYVIGTGAFGAVFSGRDAGSRGPVAIKAELKSAKVPQLVFEYGVLRELNGELGIPAVYWFGDHGDCNVLVMQRLGPSVTAVKHRLFLVPQRVSLVKHIARSVLHALHALHRNGFVHRDLKPENMLWERAPGTDEAFVLPRVFLIDFGLAKRVWMPSTGVHVGCCTGKHLTGTPRYASAHTHSGVELSRRDDIESFGYVMIYLALGALPWQCSEEYTGGEDAHFSAMGRHKLKVDPGVLAKGLPPAFADTITYARSLAFDAMPDFKVLAAMWA